MAIFSRRPLALGCAALVLTVLLSELFGGMRAVLFFIGASLFLLVLPFFIIFRRSAKPLYFLVLSLCILLAAWRVCAVAKDEAELRAREGGSAALSVTVEEIRQQSAYGSTLLVRVDAIEGTPTKARAILHTDGITPFLVGDSIEANFAVFSLRHQNTHENQHLTYRAEGAAVQLFLEKDSEVTVKSGSRLTLRAALSRIRLSAAGRLGYYIKGDAGDLAVAMLLGDRSTLSFAVEQDFRYAGVSHLLALSGLHLGILSLLAERLLRGLRLPRALRALILLLLVGFFLLFTGCSYSTLRAAVMLYLVQLAYFHKSRADALTSLFFALALILLAEPYAIFSTALQMTVLATLGILTVGTLFRVLYRRVRNIKDAVYRVLVAIPASLALTLSASLFNYPVQWLTFGEVSLITPLSNFLLVPLAAPFLYLATATLFLYPAGIFGTAAAWLGEGMLFLAARLGRADTVLVLTQDFLPYLVLPTLALTALLLILRLRHKWTVLLPHAVATLLFFALLGAQSTFYQGKTAVLYENAAGRECLLLRENGKTVLIDPTGGGSALSLGKELLAVFSESRLDYLLLPVLNDSCVERLFRANEGLLPVTLLLPAPQNEEERILLLTITREVALLGIAVSLYQNGAPLDIFERVALTVLTEGDALTVMLRGKEKSLCYQSAAAAAPMAVDYHILGSVERAENTAIAVGTPGCTVFVPDEQTLLSLVTRSDTAYRLFEQRAGFLLQ